MYIERIFSTMMAAGLSSDYMGTVEPSKSSLKKNNRLRGRLPQFKKCESCGFQVVVYQLDENQICTDCRKEDK